jgi:hypothetical protein
MVTDGAFSGEKKGHSTVDSTVTAMSKLQIFMIVILKATKEFLNGGVSLTNIVLIKALGQVGSCMVYEKIRKYQD